MGDKNRAEPAGNIENHLRARRTSKGLSQGELAVRAGITRQAVYSIENSQYLPTTAVALRLATALGCRVEDLFNLVSSGQVIEGDLIGPPVAANRARVKVARVGDRTIVRPVSDLGDLLTFTIPADGLLLGAGTGKGRGHHRVRVELLRDQRLIEEEVLVAGCDPAIFLVGEYLRQRQGNASVVGWTMGSAAAIEAVKRGDVHMAGIHVRDAKSGEWNLPYLKRHLHLAEMTVVTFAKWEEGLIVRDGNPKGIRHVADLGRKGVSIVNREEGSGARLLLDTKLREAGLPPRHVKGYQTIMTSHLEVARAVAHGMADAGLGVRSAAQLLSLEFVPLQEERYDLVIPTAHLRHHPGVSRFLDAIVSRPFRAEIEALGGYDTRETGKVIDWKEAGLVNRRP